MPSPTDCHTDRAITQPTPTQQNKQHRQTVIVGFARGVEVNDDASDESMINDGVAPAVEILNETLTDAVIFKDKFSEEGKKRKIDPEVVIEEDSLIELEKATTVVIEAEIAPGFLKEQEIAPEVVIVGKKWPEVVIEQEVAPELVKKWKITPEVVIEREITPEVVILNGSLTQTSVEEDTFQGQVKLYTNTTKFQAKSDNAPDDFFSVLSFGSDYDQQSSNDSIHTIAKDLENVSKYKFEVFEPETPGHTVSSIFIVMYSLLGLTILTLIILTFVFDYGMLLLLVMIIIIFCSIVILTNCWAMVYTV